MPSGSLFSAPVLRSMLGFPFQRATWSRPLTNLVVVYLVLFIVFPPLALLIEAGYALRMARRMMAGCPPEMSDPGAWEPILLDGLRYWAVACVFSLPSLLAIVIGLAASIYASGALSGGMAAYLLFLADHFWQAYFFTALVLLLAILALVLSTIATLHMVKQGSLADAFAIRAWWPVLRANRGGFLRAELFLVIFGLGMIILQVLAATGTVITCIGPVLVLGLAELYQRLVLTAVYAREYQKGAGLSSVQEA